MTVIVTDQGFQPDDWPAGDADAGQNRHGIQPVNLTLDTPDDQMATAVNEATHIRVVIGSFADGRGFTLARQLRRMGFSGRLRAAGPLIADQYAMARRAGFDEVEIPDSVAARHIEAHWRARADWQKPSHQERLQG